MPSGFTQLFAQILQIGTLHFVQRHKACLLYTSTSVIAGALAQASGMAYPVMAPMIGVLGSFVSSSGTVSNTLFSSLQVETATMLNMSPTLIAALQNAGAIVGAVSYTHLDVYKRQVRGLSMQPQLGQK